MCLARPLLLMAATVNVEITHVLGAAASPARHALPYGECAAGVRCRQKECAALRGVLPQLLLRCRTVVREEMWARAGADVVVWGWE